MEFLSHEVEKQFAQYYAAEHSALVDRWGLVTSAAVWTAAQMRAIPAGAELPVWNVWLRWLLILFHIALIILLYVRPQQYADMRELIFKLMWPIMGLLTATGDSFMQPAVVRHASDGYLTFTMLFQKWPVLILSFLALRLRLSHVPMAQFLMLIMFHVFWFMSYNPRLETLPLITALTSAVNASVRRITGRFAPLLVTLWPWPGPANSGGVPQITHMQCALGVCALIQALFFCAGYLGLAWRERGMRAEFVRMKGLRPSEAIVLDDTWRAGLLMGAADLFILTYCQGGVFPANSSGMYIV